MVRAVLTERQISTSDYDVKFSFQWKFHVYGPQSG